MLADGHFKLSTFFYLRFYVCDQKFASLKHLLSKNKKLYQLPFILTVHGVAHCLLTLSISQHVPLSGHDDVALFE